MKIASPIDLVERDYFLQFNRTIGVWPPENLDLFNQASRDEKKEGFWLADKWQREMLNGGKGGYLWRELLRKPARNDPPQRRKAQLRELVLRFPSAPLFGLQSKRDFQVRMESVHQHTLRLLIARGAGRKPHIKRLFLIFNGLNELDYLGFYYDLAGLLIQSAETSSDVACLIAPFPAHLARYPLFGKFAEKPLQRFITDPSDLFRQYLRFMIETQWLISALVPVSDYPVTPGVMLLKDNKDNSRGGRCDTTILSSGIYEAWKTMYAGANRGHEVSEEDVLQSITVLREVIGWRCSTTRLVDRNREEPLDPPQLHVIGYSLGGYLAQCVFFTWPFAIGSCSTLCSGGALRDLRPEKIIHEEEWRAITHGLQYEIESGMLERRIAADNPNEPEFVCGIPVSSFTSHFQTFNDIFLQDPHGSYRHRVTEFAPRMFFVVGGNDPIVPTRTLVETSPPGGINMIEIANLTHFIALEGGEWPNFWLPTICGVISSLSQHSEKLLRTTMLGNLWNDQTTDAARERESWLENIRKKIKTDAAQDHTKADHRDSEPLDSDGIQEAILDFARSIRKEGLLLILRNQIPISLMGPRVLHRRGTVPHYADIEIRRFWERLQEQRLLLLESTERITIVVPARLNEWFGQRPSTLSAKHLPVVHELPDRELQEQIWKDFLDDWEANKGALHRFNPENPLDFSKASGDLFKLERVVREHTGTPSDRWVLNCLPDAWIRLSQEAVTAFASDRTDREFVRTMLVETMFQVYTGKRTKTPTRDQKRALDNLNRCLEDGDLQVIRISAAQSSPRFLGERIWNLQAVTDLMVHSAMALARSAPCRHKNDFLNGWEQEDRILNPP